MSGTYKFKEVYSEGILRGSQSQIKKSSGASALTPDAAAQLGPKAVELQRKKAKQVDVPNFVKTVRKEEVKLGEKIDVGADAGATISDFVHSKSATFKGDSKKQRIKRALGAYYAAQKEETENLYNYVIEALVDTEFAQDYETAENMFEHMSDEFVAVILEDYIEEAKLSMAARRAANAGKKGYNKEGKPVPTGKPRVYDFDKVTADTAGTNVHIKNAKGERVQSLNDTQFYTHHKNNELEKGHSYDFSDFDSPKVLAKNAKPIKSTIASMRKAQKDNKPVMTLTARSQKVKSGVTSFLNKHGVNASKVKQHFTGDMPSHLNTGERKAITLKHIVKNNPAGAEFSDDHRGNLDAAGEVRKVRTFLAKPNKKGEVVSRSYQATKGGRTSDNPDSTIKQTQRRRNKARKNMGEEVSSYLNIEEGNSKGEFMSHSYQATKEDFDIKDKLFISFSGTSKAKNELKEESEMTPYQQWQSFIKENKIEEIQESDEIETELNEETESMTSYQAWKSYLESI